MASPTNEEDFEDIDIFSNESLTVREQFQRWIESVRPVETAHDYILWFLDVASIKITFEDVIMAMTLFVLFGDSIKILSANKSYDYSFSVMDSICLFFFVAEFVMSSTVKSTVTFRPLSFSGYIFNFFWWLDLASIVSMFPDIDWIAKGLGWGAIEDGGVTGNSQITKAGRVARLVRLVRLVRLYKIATEKRKKARKEAELMEMVRCGEIDYVDIEKFRLLYDSRSSKIGAMLSAAITKKVIILVLVILIILPLIQYTVVDNGPRFMTEFIQGALANSSLTDTSKNSIIDSFMDIFDAPSVGSLLCSLEASPFADGYIMHRTSMLNSLRTSAIVEYSESSIISGNISVVNAVFSFNDVIRKSAEYSIILIIFVGLLLVLGSSVITADAQKLVIAPIERMMNMVEAVSKDPLTPLEFTKFESGVNDAGRYETKLLENTVEKITGLLRVGFGEAGGGIIKMNLDLNNTTSAINPLIEGVRIYAIVGFCDIHNFEDVNRRLKQSVLTFVNSIAEIVHTSVAYWGGQCNKNLGNAFVIIWRIGDEDTLLASTLGKVGNGRTSTRGSDDGRSSMSPRASSRGSPSPSSDRMFGNKEDESSSRIARRKAAGHVIDLKKVPGIDLIADQALIGYLKIIAELNRNHTILGYRNNNLLTNNGEEEFKVRMGFGLHAGWAIEGAVGSIYKVDATYLSPHVNMAARLETSSRQYGVPLLASHLIYELMSTEAQSKCRKLDVVTVKGSEVPIGIYTYDCFQDQPFPYTPSLSFNLAFHTSNQSSAATRVSIMRKKSSKMGSVQLQLPSTPTSSPVQLSTTAPGSSSGKHRAMITISDIDLDVEVTEHLDQRLDTPETNNIRLTTQSRKVSFDNGNQLSSPADELSIQDHYPASPEVHVHANSLTTPNKFTLQVPSNEPITRGAAAKEHEAVGAVSAATSIELAASVNDVEPIFNTVNEEDPADVFEKDIDMLLLRAHITPEFLQSFDLGVANYLGGNWSAARTSLERSNVLMMAVAPSLNGDGPSLTLLAYMEERQWTAPADWQGYRPLTSK